MRASGLRRKFLGTLDVLWDIRSLGGERRETEAPAMATPHAIPVALSGTDRDLLQGWIRRRKTGQALATRARIVLACAEPGTTNGGVAGRLGVSRATVALWRRRFAERWTACSTSPGLEPRAR